MDKEKSSDNVDIIKEHQKNEKSKRIIKKRHWAFVVYPESAPADWVEQLQQKGLQCAVSPLHDKDIDPTGELKKSHYHVIITYSGPTSFSIVQGITESLNAPVPIALEQVKGYYRYLTHKDNPEKFQYDENDIKTINGFDITEFVEVSKAELLNYKIEIEKLIDEKNIIEYSILLRYLRSNDLLHLYEVASSHTIWCNAYIKSCRHMAEKEIRKIETGEIKVDIKTGEVIE
jgi:hypothetical protein